MPSINAYHDSTSLRFREPFGAVKTGESVTLRLILWGPAADSASVTLRTWNGEERFYSGSSKSEFGARVFEFCFTVPDKPCVLWYNFRVISQGRLRYVGAADGELRSGPSVLTQDVPHDFRITVYDRDFKTPERFCGRIAYQIFPDRFRRGEYPGLEAGIAHHRALGRRVTVKEWNEEVDYLPRGNEPYYSPQDYFLGNFRGIVDKIPYLKSLGVEVLYLNPVFESAFNHRYSISDYMRVDPLLGSEEDFCRMAEALHEADIKLILDGVFSHTGDDSIYFDRRGNYGGGAWSDPGSPYRDWYDFSPKYKHGFRCWWDFETLPEVEELTPSYMDFIAKVLEKWIRLGADGWRLDVADELPDEFIKFLRARLKAIDPEAILIGEVWEDAVTKTDGEGRRREYVNGFELDGVMDYPFFSALIDFLRVASDSYALKRELASQLEGYPKPFMQAQLGLIGSHDTPRVLSILAGGPKKDTTLTRQQQAVWRPTEANAAKAEKLLKLASAVQFSMPFMPCVYYGDEAGLTGLIDPFCRRPYPWGHENAGLLEHYRRMAALRASDPVFAGGACAFAAPHADVFAVARMGGGEALTVINRSEREVNITLRPGDFTGETLPRLFGSYELEGGAIEAAGALSLTLGPLSYACLIMK